MKFFLLIGIKGKCCHRFDKPDDLHQKVHQYNGSLYETTHGHT